MSVLAITVLVHKLYVFDTALKASGPIQIANMEYIHMDRHQVFTLMSFH